VNDLYVDPYRHTVCCKDLLLLVGQDITTSFARLLCLTVLLQVLPDELGIGLSFLPSVLAVIPVVQTAMGALLFAADVKKCRGHRVPLLPFVSGSMRTNVIADRGGRELL
jgi:hypothetical protein